MSIAVFTKTYAESNDHTWLGKLAGIENCDSITLDKTTCIAKWTDGLIKSGYALAKITASGKFGPFDAAATDGRQLTTFIGHLFDDKSLIDANHPAGADETAALYWGPGEVIEANLPTTHGVTSGFKTAMKLIKYL
jgi:hypothetical protein